MHFTESEFRNSFELFLYSDYSIDFLHIHSIEALLISVVGNLLGRKLRNGALQ